VVARQARTRSTLRSERVHLLRARASL